MSNITGSKEKVRELAICDYSYTYNNNLKCATTPTNTNFIKDQIRSFSQQWLDENSFLLIKINNILLATVTVMITNCINTNT